MKRLALKIKQKISIILCISMIMCMIPQSFFVTYAESLKDLQNDQKESIDKNYCDAEHSSGSFIDDDDVFDGDGMEDIPEEIGEQEEQDEKEEKDDDMENATKSFIDDEENTENDEDIKKILEEPEEDINANEATESEADEDIKEDDIDEATESEADEDVKENDIDEATESEAKEDVKENDGDVATTSEIDEDIENKEEIYVATENDIEYKDDYGYIPEGMEAPIVHSDKLVVGDSVLLGAGSNNTTLKRKWDPREGMKASGSDMSLLPPVRDQGDYGSCWAHAAIACMEISARKKGLVKTEEESNFSEAALVYYMYAMESIYDNVDNIGLPGVQGMDYQTNAIAPQGLGNNAFAAAGLFSCYCGPVVEDENTKYDNDHMAEIFKKGIDGKYAYNSNTVEMNKCLFLNKANTDLIKKAIVEHGAVAIMYHTSNQYGTDPDGKKFYYYSDIDEGANHCVTCVGWDDDIPKENFKNGDKKPKNNGGWLIRQSWGKSYKDNGYFWLSYEEPSFSSNVYAFDVREAGKYKYNYHYDTIVTGGKFVEASDNDKVANIFKVQNENQILEAINVIAYEDCARFQVDIYTSDKVMENPTAGDLERTFIFDSEIDNAGVAGTYTIELENKLKLKKNTYFSIVISPKKLGKDKNKITISYSDSSDNTSATRQRHNEVEDGQSWLFHDGKWQDRSSSRGHSISIKALTNPEKNILPCDWSDCITNKSEVERIVIQKGGSKPTGEYDEVGSDDGLSYFIDKDERKNVIIYINEANSVIGAGDTEEEKGLFSDFTSLIAIEGLDNIDTSNTTNMHNMFKGCENLLDIDLFSFNTKSVVNMEGMFNGCKGIKSLDISSFDSSSIKKIDNMFNDCISLRSVYANDTFTINGSFSSVLMFDGCDKLVGEKGFTMASASIIGGDAKSAKYACIDSDTKPGYFSSDYYIFPVNWASESFVIKENIKTIKFVKGDNGGREIVNVRKEYDIPESRGLKVLVLDDNEIVVYAKRNNRILAPEDSSKMFYGCKALESVTNIGYLDTSNVKNMRQMFEECSSIKKLNITNFNTKFVVNMSNMFKNCKALVNLRVSAFDTGCVENMYGMFEGCQNLSEVDVLRFNTAKVSTMSNMFKGCVAITNIDMRKWDTKEVKYINGMFDGCKGLTSLDLANFNMSNVVDVSNMFNGCNNLSTIYVSNAFSLNISNQEMFGGCDRLVGEKGFTMASASIIGGDAKSAKYACIDSDIKSGYFSYGYYIFPKEWFESDRIGKKDITSITFIKNGVDGCSGPPTEGIKYVISDSNGLELYEKDTEITIYAPIGDNYIKLVEDASGMFANMKNLKNITGLEYLDTSNVKNMYAMFYNISVDSINVSSFDTSNVTNMSQMFRDCTKLANLDVSNFDTRNVIDMSSMFNYCSGLKSLDLSNFDTSKVINMSEMFSSCTHLKSLEVNALKFNTSNVTDMSYMFYGCVNFKNSKSLPFDTSNVENMSYMFCGCAYIDDSITSNFDTRNVTNMSSMFKSSIGIMNFDASNFDTRNVTDMSNMFNNCSVLKSLDLSNFDTSKVINMDAMFNGAKKLKTIYVLRDFDTKKVTSKTLKMFTNCNVLEGGNGTHYNSSNDDKEYARIDGEVGPGYFTYVGVKINFDMNGHGSTPSTIKMQKNSTISETISIPTEVGYTFGGWYKEKECKDQWNFDEDIVTTDMILYAKWNVNKYKVNFVINGGTINSGFIEEYTYGEGAILPTDVTPPINVSTASFIGWYDNDSFIGSRITAISTTDTGDKKYFAKYVIKHVIIFNANGGEGTMAKQDVYDGENITISGNTFTKTGYYFAGWKTESGVSYSDRGIISDVKKDIILYAQWDVSSSNLQENSDKIDSGRGGISGGGSGGHDVIGAKVIKQFIEPIYQINTQGGIKTILTSDRAVWNYNPILNIWSLYIDGGKTKATNGLYKIVKTEQLVNSGISAPVVVENIYCFDDFGNMLVGWLKAYDGTWYFFDVLSGEMEYNGKKEIEGKVYYFDALGKMLENTITPDGHIVGVDGAVIR